MKIDYCKEEMVLKVYPTVGGCFQEAWTVLRNHFAILLLAIIFGGILETPIGYKQYINNLEGLSFGITIFSLFGFIYYMVVVAPFSYGINWLFLQAARKNNPQFEEIVAGFKKFLYVVLSHLLVIVLSGVGFLFLIIPGIYIVCKLAFVPYLIVDKKVDPMQAIKLSFYMTKGYFWTILGMGIFSFFVIILGVICFIVGVFVSFVWINAAFAVLYNAVEDLHYKEACQKAGIPIEPVTGKETQTNGE